MAIRFNNETLQQLAEKLLKPDELQLLQVNQGQVTCAMFPYDKKAVRQLMLTHDNLIKQADRIRISGLITSHLFFWA